MIVAAVGIVALVVGLVAGHRAGVRKGRFDAQWDKAQKP